MANAEILNLDIKLNKVVLSPLNRPNLCFVIWE